MKCSTWARLLSIAAIGCSETSQRSNNYDAGDGGPTHATAGDASAAVGAFTPSWDGLTETPGGWKLRTSVFSLSPGAESYQCYAVHVPEDLVIEEISTPDTPGLHHALLVQPLSPEKDGPRECHVIARATWAPLFVATTAAAKLHMPSGAAKILEKGSQLLVQAHLVNPRSAPLEIAVEVNFRRSLRTNPEPVGLTIMGSANFEVPAGRSTVVSHTCRPTRDLHLYAVLPHMHRLGRKLELLVPGADGGLQPIYSRDPYDFDDQRLDEFERLIPAGTPIETRCYYGNSGSASVPFGESASDEMCFAFGFTVGEPEFQFCSDYTPSFEAKVPRDAEHAACPIGSAASSCSPAGEECGSGRFCSADFLNMDRGICFDLGCERNSDCPSPESTCCTLPYVGDIANLCLPESCRPDFCIPVDRRATQH